MPRISDYDELVAPNSNDFLPIVHGGITQKIRLGAIQTGGSGGSSAPLGAVNAADHGSDGAAIAAALALAAAIGARRLYIPIGTWVISQGQVDASPQIYNLFGMDYLEVFGDGIGKTVIQLPASMTVNAGDTTVFGMSGRHQRIHDITFVGSPSVSGTAAVVGVAIQGLKNEVFDCEFYGFNANTTAGAAAVTTYGGFAPLAVNTTLGTAIAAGTRTVTPASMNGIYKGRLLTIGGTAENVTVTAITPTTFTAVFANAHGSTDAVTASAQWYTGATLARLDIHDCPKATGIVINSTGNCLSQIRMEHIGNASTQHGFYVQAGLNFFQDIWIQGIAGYSIHQYPNYGGVVDSSGNVYDRIRSIDPGTFHVLIQGENRSSDDVANGSDPLLPAGIGLSRYTVITNSLFKNTRATGDTFASISLSGPTYFDGNILEDVTLVDTRSPYTIITPNNVSRRIFASPYVAALPVTIGGGVKMFEGAPDGRTVRGQTAFPETTGGGAGGNVDIVPGWGIRRFTVVSNTAGAVSLTVTALPDNGINNFTLVSGTDFTLGSDNSDAQKHATAVSLADAINAVTNVYHYAAAYAVGPTVYLMPNTAFDLIIGTNQSGRISVTSGSNGQANVWSDLEMKFKGQGLILNSPDGTKRARITINNGGVLTTTLL
jgi:hypothetical protein